ncbi:MAG TPA: transcriptional regulator, partial [Deltaproteobacteria bacterium]|nr:transcriptional regulator [Deltaproteobacteria bacterium]
MKIKKASENIFEDLGFSKAEAANLEARSRLMMLLEDEIKKLKVSNNDAAKILGVKAPRISELFHGRIEKFSLDLLVSYLARLGKRVD